MLSGDGVKIVRAKLGQDEIGVTRVGDQFFIETPNVQVAKSVKEKLIDEVDRLEQRKHIVRLQTSKPEIITQRLALRDWSRKK